MKRLTQILFLFAFLVLGSTSLKAQDIHFSQFYLSPLNLNPAMTGVMNCNVRLVANYRNQWSSVLKQNAFKTYSASYDQRIAVGRYDFVGIGGSFWGDKAGESEFSTLQGKLSASYSKKMGGYRSKAHYLVFGAEAGVTQKFTLHAGGEFLMTSKLGLVPGVVTFFQGPSFQLNTGTSLKFLLGNSRTNYQAFQIGAWMRISNHFQQSVTADALILSTKFDYNDFAFGFSYDVNVSSLNAASNSQGAFEFSMIYKICGNEKRNVYCPNF